MARGALELDAAEHPSVFVNFEAEVLSQDRARRVRGALERLNENQRHVIELAYFEGLSQSEMAERMGQPLGTVKTWVRTALKHLRDDLSEKAVTA
jgi:RNA polymerase sigma-70 factor (ECF subfamily)